MTFDTNTPKNPGDRSHGHGDQVTLVLDAVETDGELNEDGKLPAGHFVDFDGAGGVVRSGDADGVYNGTYDAILMNSAAPGEEVTVNIRGLIRAAEDPLDNWPVADEVDGDFMVVLR